MKEIENEKNNATVPSVGIIAFQNGQVLLVRHNEQAGHTTGVYGLPAGRLDAGEAELDAAVREFHEETGLTAKSEDFTEFPDNYFEANISRKDGSVMHVGWRVFLVKQFSGNLVENKETTPEWMSIEHVAELEKNEVLLPNVQTAIKRSTQRIIVTT